MAKKQKNTQPGVPGPTDGFPGEGQIPGLDSREDEKTGLFSAPDSLTPPIPPSDVLNEALPQAEMTIKDLRGRYVALSPFAKTPFWGIRGRDGISVSVGENRVARIPDDINDAEYRMIISSIESSQIMLVDSEEYRPAASEPAMRIVDMTSSNVNHDAFFLHDTKNMDRFEDMVNGCDSVPVLAKTLELEQTGRNPLPERMDIVKGRLTVLEGYLKKRQSAFQV